MLMLFLVFLFVGSQALCMCAQKFMSFWIVGPLALVPRGFRTIQKLSTIFHFCLEDEKP